ncbi:reverse transcriptase domain-containing protein [Tanacetum coccineum]
MDSFCDYHQEKGNYTNDCFQLKRKLEIALESCKLNHLVKDNEDLMNVPITFPPIAPGDLSDEPLIKAEIEGYLARRVHVDEGRSGIKELGATPSTIHSMMKFPIPRGIATLVTRPTIRSECRKSKKKQIIEELVPEEELQEIALTEEVLVNPNFPNQLVTIEGNLSPEGMNQLKTLLKNNQDVFACELSDMSGVPRRIIKHTFNVNLSVQPIIPKRRVLSAEKSQMVTQDVAEWLKAKYAVKLGAYDITYEPHNTIKGQVLANFLTKTPICNSKDMVVHTSGRTVKEYQDSFLSTKNEAEYEALLAGLQIASKMKVRLLALHVDSKFSPPKGSLLSSEVTLELDTRGGGVE